MKPILIGQNNPVSTLPGYELYPLPRGCSGNRLYEMLRARVPEVTMRQYVDTFERRNLVRGVDYDGTRARARAHEIAVELGGTGRTVVLLGQEVRKAFGHPPVLIHPQEIGGCTWRQLPHPSGRNTWYSVPKNIKVAELLMEELYNDYRRRQEQSVSAAQRTEV